MTPSHLRFEQGVTAIVALCSVVVSGLAALLEAGCRRLFHRPRVCGRCNLWVSSEPREGHCSRTGEVVDSAAVCPFELDRPRQ